MDERARALRVACAEMKNSGCRQGESSDTAAVRLVTVVPGSGDVGLLVRAAAMCATSRRRGEVPVDGLAMRSTV